MKLFLDTSALIKAFHKEKGSDTIIKLLTNDDVKIWISELTKIEYKSAIYRVFNNKQISKQDLKTTLQSFDNYLKFININPLSSLTVSEANSLFDKYYSFGLRSLDALQFASFTLLLDTEIFFVTSDKKLESIVKMSGFDVINPLTYNL